MDEFIHHPLRLRQLFLRGALLPALLTLNACSRPAADFTLTLGGDIMLAREGEPIFISNGLPINPWQALQKTGVLIEANSQVPDFFFANLESPLDENSNELTDMNLCSHPDQIKVLVDGGLDLVSLTNNHRNDCSDDGPAQTKSHLEEENIQSAIMGAEAAYLDTPRGKLAVIAAEDVTGSLDVAFLLSVINNAGQHDQVVVVSMHWGNEYQAGADERQQKLAQQMADAGADVIWGHHPHVLQKMEWLESVDGRQVLVIYSLGNLLADQWMLEDAKQSALVKLTFVDNEIGKIEIIPLVMDRSTKSLHFAEPSEVRDEIFDRLGVGTLSSETTRIDLILESN
jgi:poly-gamma-glutamate capsule biosynthesis protein CapA/YwtB (metallophosphatase superfamily)